MRLNILSFLFLFLLSCSNPAHKKRSDSKSAANPITNATANYTADTTFTPTVEYPTYINAKPILCFDEGHNNLAVQHEFYRSILGLLESDGYQIEKLKTSFNISNIRKCDILYSSAALSNIDLQLAKKTMASAYAQNEIKVLYQWVKAGGSLLIATDHRPMSDGAAELLKKFKIKGSIFTTENIATAIPNLLDPSNFYINIIDKNLNPILMGRSAKERVTTVFTFAGQAIKGAENVQIIVPLPQSAKKSDDSFNALVLAQKLENGRVVVTGDATLFTSKLNLKTNEKTGINRAGSDNVKLALNIFHWLSKAIDPEQVMDLNLPVHAHYPKPTEVFISSLKDGSSPAEIVHDSKIVPINSYFKRGLKGTRPTIYLRSAVSDRLRHAAKLLPDGFSIAVFDGFRSLETQWSIWYEFYNTNRARHPEWTEDQIYKETRKFASNPDEKGRFPVPPHQSGGAVDVGLIDASGNLLNMGGDFDEMGDRSSTAFYEKGRPAKSATSQALWAEARKNRRILFHAMVESGFSNYSEEWWHYDLGTCVWSNIHQSDWFYSSMEPDVLLSLQSN